MPAIIIRKYGGPEQLVIQKLPEPEPSGHVVIEVKAFGINHAETHM
jgi:NADPH:quinone reductase-like Zn-dependent oxidoreductase